MVNLLELKSLNKNSCPLWDSKVEWVIEMDGTIQKIAINGNNEKALDTFAGVLGFLACR